MTKEEISNVISDNNKKSFKIFIFSVLLILSLVSLLFANFNVSVVAIIVTLILTAHSVYRYVDWRNNISQDHRLALTLSETMSLSPEMISDQFNTLKKHEQRVDEWFENLSDEDKEMATWYAKKFFNEEIKNI